MIEKKEQSLAWRVLEARGRTADWEELTRPLPEAAAFDPELTAQILGDPYALRDMETAVEVLSQAVKEGRRILVYGDYDTDGVSASAILIQVLRGLGLSPDYFLPHRIKDGYGLRPAGLDYIRSCDAELVITVDCGSQNHEEIAELQAEGRRVIVTDHHCCPEELPAATALVNPNRHDDHSGLGHLAGAGVALKLSQALSTRLGQPELWLQGLDLAALGTVGDMMRLEGENRRLVQLGLARMRSRLRPGLEALLGRMKQPVERVDSTVLGFQISPRLNACGRMDHASTALELLLEDDLERAWTYQERVEELNEARRTEERRCVDEALTCLAQHPELLDSAVLVLAFESWNLGVLGIVAARLVRKFARPALVLTIEGGLCKGSGRSFGDIDLLGLLDAGAPWLRRYGGHRNAVGLELAEEDLDDFRQALAEIGAQLPEEAFRGQEGEEAELEIRLEDLTLEQLHTLELLEPYGRSNPEPVFHLEAHSLQECRAVGKDQSHLRLVLDTGQQDPRQRRRQTVAGIAFGWGHQAAFLSRAPGLGLDLRLRIGSFRSIERPEFVVQDIRPLIKNQDAETYFYTLLDQYEADSQWNWAEARTSAGVYAQRRLQPGPDLLVQLYRALQEQKEALALLSLADLRGLVDERLFNSNDVPYFQLAAALHVYAAAGLFWLRRWDRGQELALRRYCLIAQSPGRRQKLTELRDFCRLAAD